MRRIGVEPEWMNCSRTRASYLHSENWDLDGGGQLLNEESGSPQVTQVSVIPGS